MKTITLNKKTIFEKGKTTKYWQDVECEPQTAQLGTWSSGYPYFKVEGVIVESHDSDEIGKKTIVYCQMYDFELKSEVVEGRYTINE